MSCMANLAGFFINLTSFKIITWRQSAISNLKSNTQQQQAK